MGIEQIRGQLQDYAKDTKINLSKMLSDEGVDGLTVNQSYQTALACAYAIQNEALVSAILDEEYHTLTPEEITATKAAATIMAMNNVYYRFIHLVSDKEYMSMPAGLRMNVIANPGY